MGSKMGHGYATQTNQFGNFDFGQSRMAGDAFKPNEAFMQGQRDFVKEQQGRDKVPNFNMPANNNPVVDMPNSIIQGGNTYNYGDGPKSGDRNYSYSYDNKVDQKSDQDASANTEFGDVTNNLQNASVSDFGEMNIFNNQYGGDNKAINITYQGEGAQLKATPIRDMQMGGMFDVSDSPAKTAGFIGKYTDLNRANQSSYSNTGVKNAQKYIEQGKANKVVDIGALDTQVRTSPLYHRDMSRVEGAFTFGDRYATGGSQPKWTYDPKPEKEYGIDPVIKDKALGDGDDD